MGLAEWFIGGTCLVLLSFLIGGDGNLYEGRGWNVLGAHTQGYNSRGYGVCFLGSYTFVIPGQDMIDVYHRYEEVYFFKLRH